MNRKEIQKQRMIVYFVEAAKEIIVTEGINNLTVRKVGEKAGYSYATIYNYFKDINTLMIYCVQDFFHDCHKHLISFNNKEKDSREQLIIYAIEFFKYFAERPEMFQLLYLEDLNGFPPELNSPPIVVSLFYDTLINCSKEGYIKEEAVEILFELLGSSVHSKLLFYLKRNSGSVSMATIIETIKKEIYYLLDRGEAV